MSGYSIVECPAETPNGASNMRKTLGACAAQAANDLRKHVVV
jgi:hypothetical protein